MRAAPVRLDNAAFGATCGTCSLEHSVPGVFKSTVFGGFPTLVFERLHGADAVRVAGCGIGLCGFHLVFHGRQLPAQPSPVTRGLAGEFTLRIR